MSEHATIADGLKKEAGQEIEEKRRILHSSLQLACRQAVEMLKQKVEKELFNPELSTLVERETANPQLIAHIVQGFVRSLETQGIEEDFEVCIPKDVSPRTINALLGANILKRLKENSVKLGDFHAGVQIKMKDRKITIDLSDAAIKEMIGQYVRRDFRDLLFQV